MKIAARGARREARSTFQRRRIMVAASCGTTIRRRQLEAITALAPMPAMAAREALLRASPA